MGKQAIVEETKKKIGSSETFETAHDALVLRCTKLPFSTNSSYSSSCDIEMFVVMQRRQPKMAEIGLSSPYSFDRKICNSILLSMTYVYTYINTYYACDLTAIRNMCQTHRNQHSIHYC